MKLKTGFPPLFSLAHCNVTESLEVVVIVGMSGVSGTVKLSLTRTYSDSRGSEMPCSFTAETRVTYSDPVMTFLIVHEVN